MKNMARKETDSLLERKDFRSVIVRIVNKVVKYICIFLCSITALSLFIAVAANHMESSAEVKQFVAASPQVTAMAGPIKSSDVTIHSLSEFYESGNLTVGAVVVASGPLGHVRVALNGVRPSDSSLIEFRLREIGEVHCPVILYCIKKD